VVTGVVMPFQFGTNWSRYADATSNVLSPLFAYEGLTAFFLEAGFLGVLLFGRKLVPPWAHFFAALMVALGTLFSARWDTERRVRLTLFAIPSEKAEKKLLCHRDSLARQPHPHTRPRRCGQGSQGLPRRPTSACGDTVLRLSRNGGMRGVDAGACCFGRMVAV